MVRRTLQSLAGSAILTAGLAAVATAASAADTVAFTLSSPWTAGESQAAADGSRKFNQWHVPGDPTTTVTLIEDTTTSYTDSLGMIEKNFSDNHIKTSINKDFTCAGKTAHDVEFATGPDGHQVTINRILIPDGTGVMTVTYARAASDGGWDKAVLDSVKAYCGTTPLDK
jgi:hypothetical protein